MDMDEDNRHSAPDLLMVALRQLIHEELEVPMERIGPDFDLREEMDVDSLDFVEILIAAEERFDVELPDASASSIRTLRDLHDALANALSRRAH